VSYPGNPSLPAPVKDRVVTTFQQTLALFKQGRMDEVSAGCNLLLQMDPTFEPARKLLEKMRNPGAAIDVDRLLPSPGDERSPLEQAREAMAARDFERVLHLTSAVLTDDMMNDEARVMGDEAREKLEAAPFVEQFARKASQSLDAGNVAAAKMELEKARALDSSHPEVVRVSRLMEGRITGSGTMAVPPPSFVVDDRAGAQPGSRSTAQAADFGFTFEEDKPAETSFSDFSFAAPTPGDFSFDAPKAEAPKQETPFGGFSFDATPAAKTAGTASEFDFTTASVATSEDDQKKIEQYLADGDRAFEAADYSQAIDLWSRIFLIDVTNDQASERIERAKARRQEQERKAEQLLAVGVEAFERGDTAKAHADLTEVLRLDPRNTMAQEYLDRLSDTLKPEPVRPAPSQKEETYDLFDDDLSSGFGSPGFSDAMEIPEAGEEATKARARATVPPPARKLPLGMLALVLGVLVLGVGGWFAWSRFANAPEVQEDPGAGAAIMGRASMLARRGDYDRAIALLRDIKPGDPQHDKAMVMIADLQQKKSTSAALIDGVPAAQYYDQRIAAASAAFAAGDYSAAKTAFEQAMRVQALPANLKAQYDRAAQEASKLNAARALFAERKYADAIKNLEPLLAADPQNISIQRMLGDAHFNQAAVALQEERTADAIRELDETLKLAPNDELARRSRELAVRYNNEPKDLLYKIYVKYLPVRAG
jgi:tetratricopeptide (TPR) repeat protein